MPESARMRTGEAALEDIIGRKDERALLLRLDVLQFLASVAVWIAVFYIAILGKEMGLTDFEIGILAIVYGLSLLFSNYFFGSLSDVRDARLFLIVGFLFSSAMFLVHVFVFNYMSLLWVRLITGVALGIYPGALYSVARAANRIHLVPECEKATGRQSHCSRHVRTGSENILLRQPVCALREQFLE